MQSLNIPTGPRNPNSYTAAEIRNAILRTTGTASWSFRYELLGLDNEPISELAQVESCEITQNWLADIKRSARFMLRSDGQIDFLSNRIKPHVRLQMPQVLLGAGLVLNGQPGNYASAPYHPALSVSGDLGLQADATRDWQPGGGIRILAGVADHDVNPGNLSYYMSLNNAGQLRLTWSTTGSDFNTAIASVLPSSRVAMGRLAVYAYLDVDNGSGGHTVIFYTAPTIDGPWTELGTPQTDSGVVSIHPGVAPLEAGSRSVGTIQLWTGRIHALRVYDGDTLIANPDFDQQPAGATEFRDQIGHTWTVHGDASIQGATITDGSYVEWPQGVFLPVSPQRESDTTSAVRREVQGYDQLQIYLEDQIPSRYAAPSGSLYTDEIFELLSPTAKLVVSDDFNRAVPISGGWDQADGTGQAWTTTGDGHWEVNSGIGRMSEVSLFFDGVFATVDIDLDNIELRVRVSLNDDSDPDASVVTRYTDGLHYYEFAVGTVLDEYAIWRRNGAGSYDKIASTSIPGGYQTDEWINIRASCVGAVLQAKFWRDTEPEPSEWTLAVTDTTHGSGTVGLAMFGAIGIYTASFDNLRIFDPFANISIVHSDKTLPATREWEPGTTKLQIINHLLQAINYESLSFDGDGRAVIQPYVPPSERSPEFTYADNELSIIRPEVLQEIDLFSVPNRWMLVVSEPDRDPIVATYTNNDPASPTSTIRRGRTITDFRTEVEAADLATLVAKVARLAFEASQVYEAIEFRTALNPIHSGNDVYRIEFSPLAINGQYAEHEWIMTLKAGVLMRHRARRVVNV